MAACADPGPLASGRRRRGGWSLAEDLVVDKLPAFAALAPDADVIALARLAVAHPARRPVGPGQVPGLRGLSAQMGETEDARPRRKHGFDGGAVLRRRLGDAVDPRVGGEVGKEGGAL